MTNPPVHHGDQPAPVSAVDSGGATVESGYSRLLPNLPAAFFRPDQLDQAAAQMEMPAAEVEQTQARWGSTPQADPTPAPSENPDIAAAYTYFGQFVDHDLTFDVGSRLERAASDPGMGPVNFRTPRFDLDSVYGRGPESDPYLYASDGRKLELGGAGDDLLRRTDDVAIQPDPRNDENALVAQVHLAVMRLHNQLAEESTEASFEEIQRRTRWHYQWVVLHDFLPKICGDLVYHDLLYGRGPVLLRWPYGQFVPVEFSAAAYRFGHSQVRESYKIAEDQDPRPIFGPEGSDLRGGSPVNLPGRQVDWTLLVDAAKTPSLKIDTALSPSLFKLFGDGDEAADPPELPPGLGSHLAARNLRRGVVLGLPSGETVLRELTDQRGLVTPSDYEAIGQGDDLDAIESTIRSAFWKETPEAPPATPLWGWVLAEAELAAEGKHLGPVGGRIVGETIVGLMQADPRSLVRSAPGWSPAASSGAYELRELLLPDS